MSRKLVAVSVALLLAATLIPVAQATQVIQRTPQELARESSLIVDGRVASVRSFWNEDHTRILTETTVTVAATHKGTGATTVRVLQPGGVVGNVRQTAHGALAWSRGEEVLLFLEPATPGTWQVSGFSQGKYAVERDARTGNAYLRQAVSPDSEPAKATGRVSMQQFLNDVLPRE